MIDTILEIIRKEVNDFIGQKLSDTTVTDRVVLTSFVDESGRVAIPQDTVGVSLLNIEEEKTLKQAGVIATGKAEDKMKFVSPPVNLNLQVMFTAYFNNYRESLKHISYILACFQTRPVFTLENTPGLQGAPTEKLVFELNTLGLQEQHYIWSMIGLRYIPSVIFKVKMLTVFEREVMNEAAAIKQVFTTGNLKELHD